MRQCKAIAPTCLMLALALGCSRKPPEQDDGGGRDESKPARTQRHLTLNLGAGVTMELVRISAGKFTMGSSGREEGSGDDERPPREVTISRAFHIGVTEVTQAQWHAVMRGEPWDGRSSVKTGADWPAVYLSWTDAVEFCKKLSEKTGKTVRLPTEAEWEYACRAGTKTRFYYGQDPGYRQLRNYAWYYENAWGKDERYGHRVRRKKPNAWGLYDMHGNVWEWCGDWYAKDAYAPGEEQTDPRGPDSGRTRVLRGGSCGIYAKGCRSAARGSDRPVGRDTMTGFRVVVSGAAGQEASPTRPALTRPAAASPAAVAAKLKALLAPGRAAYKRLPKKLALDVGKGVVMRFVLIPPGSFLMGSGDSEPNHRADEGPPHKVVITRPFYMGATEVTQEQHVAVTGKNPSVSRSPKKPVARVSWLDALEFCRLLTDKAARPVLLPTEAQWEYACRAGGQGRFSFGQKDEDLHKYGNYCDRSCSLSTKWQDRDHDDGHAKTAPVGSYKPNAWGLYDMHGNVWERCSDWYSEGYYASGTMVDPQGPAEGEARVLRGGSWFVSASACRSANRHNSYVGVLGKSTGFRVILPVK